MEEIIKILLVILVSSVKFLAGPPIAYYGQLSEFSFFEANIYCIIGGSAGVVFFMFLSTHIIQIFNKIKYFFLKTENIKSQKIFTARSRRTVKFWRSYGLVGIAFITPIILSIPVGTFIAVKLNSNKKKIFLYMFCSIVLWSILMTTFFEAIERISLEELSTR